MEKAPLILVAALLVLVGGGAHLLRARSGASAPRDEMEGKIRPRR